MDREDFPRLTIVVGAIAALAGVAAAAASGAPYLGADGVSFGLIVLGAGLFAALFATPFAFERRLREAEPDRDRHWERALIRWSLVAAGVLAIGGLLALAFGLSGHSLGGSVAIVVLADGALIAGTLVAWMFSN